MRPDPLGGAGLATPMARAALLAGWVASLFGAVLDAQVPAPTPAVVVGFAAALLGALCLTHPVQRKLSPRWAAAVVACAAVSGASVLTGQVWSGETRLFNFASYLAALLVARGNPVAGLGTGAGLVVGAGVWSAFTAQPTSAIAALVLVPATALVLGTLWRVVLVAMLRRERVHHAVVARTEAQLRAEQEATASHRAEMSEVRRQAAPVLAGLASGEVIDDALAHDASVLEATLRDRITHPQFQEPSVVAAVERARARGVTVTLLVEGASAPGPELSADLAAAIDGSDAGAVVLRRPPGAESDTTLVLTRNGSTSRLTFGAGGDLSPTADS
ncbi:MAG: hypothetical protein ACI379_03815 [Nocardioides sp.]|uniref:hypothetical protein n=1 Tax=Nocardioides sp. TaxID=35761 RepID=UPI003F0EE816